MAKIQAEKQYNNFVRGLITEANPLTFPENASLDEDNFVLNRDGSRSRRLGVNYEDSFSLVATGIASTVLQGSKQSFHSWPFPGGATDVSIGVVRIYNKLWFVDLLSSAPSSSLLNGGVAITLTGLQNSDIETTVLSNHLIIVSSDLDSPVLLSYNPDTDQVTQENITMQVRDIWGVDDGLAVDARPTTLSASHKYNLRNQGWSTRIQSPPYSDVLDAMVGGLGFYPSNSDVWTTGKNENVQDAGYGGFNVTFFSRLALDIGDVARGSFILDLFSRGTSRTTLSGITGLPHDHEMGNLTTVTTYAGRAFYSGITSSIDSGDAKSPNYSGYIFFSRTAPSKGDFGKCYQVADPTSPEISDVVDTDGGTIQIPEASKIVKLISAKGSLLVLAENGVWEVFGDTNGFVATSYQMSKVTSVGVSNPKAVVDANGTIIYWAKSGIYVLTQDQASGRYVAQSLSIGTIQTFYNDLTDLAKNNARGFFDERENRIRWLYNDTATYDVTNFSNKYNRELVLDLTLQAFYPTSIAITAGLPFVTDYVDIPGYVVNTQQDIVYVNNDVVQVGGVDVYINSEIPTARRSQFSYLTLSGTSFTFSKQHDLRFLDWFSHDSIGTNYSSFLVTGYEIAGDIMRYKQVPHILFYFERTEDGFTQVGPNLEIDHPSSCLVQAQWNWTDSANSGKWGVQFQAYRLLRNYIPSGPADTFDYGDRVIVTKNKLRGSGRALSLKIQSEQGKDMRLLGWAVRVTGDSTP